MTEKGFKVTGEDSLTLDVIDSKKLPDQHYDAIASNAAIVKPSELNILKDKFTIFFGVEWEEALKKNMCLNALDECKEFGCDSDPLQTSQGYRSQLADNEHLDVEASIIVGSSFVSETTNAIETTAMFAAADDFVSIANTAECLQHAPVLSVGDAEAKGIQNMKDELEAILRQFDEEHEGRARGEETDEDYQDDAVSVVLEPVPFRSCFRRRSANHRVEFEDSCLDAETSNRNEAVEWQVVDPDGANPSALAAFADVEIQRRRLVNWAQGALSRLDNDDEDKVLVEAIDNAVFNSLY